MAYSWEINKPASVKLGSDNPLGKTYTFNGMNATNTDATITNKGIKGMFWLTGHATDEQMTATDNADILLMSGAIRVINEDVEETE